MGTQPLFLGMSSFYFRQVPCRFQILNNPLLVSENNWDRLLSIKDILSQLEAEYPGSPVLELEQDFKDFYQSMNRLKLLVLVARHVVEPVIHPVEQ